MKRFSAALLLSLMATPVVAHVGQGESSAFMAGATHPFSGFDHILAMVAVGLWAGLRGDNARWIWPASFVGAMIFGGVLAMSGAELPFVEQGILASVLALGLALAFGFRAPVGVGAALIGVAGICHGFAHGAEAPLSGGGALYALGFVLATSLLHAVGLFAIITLSNTWSHRVARLAGLATLAGGAYIALGTSL